MPRPIGMLRRTLLRESHESLGVVGFGGLRSGFEVGGAIGEILGVYGQALTEGDLTDGHFSVCLVGVVGGVPRREKPRIVVDAVRRLTWMKAEGDSATLPLLSTA